jgi:hypothetical protein
MSHSHDWLVSSFHDSILFQRVGSYDMSLYPMVGAVLDEAPCRELPTTISAECSNLPS